jgi:hypothetical protein
VGRFFTAGGMFEGFAPALGELFPDPNLEDVADGVNGWQFINGFPTFGPIGGTGPGIQADECADDDGGSLSTGGSDDTAFLAATAPSAVYNVAITFANVTVSEEITVDIRGGTSVAFIPANGTETLEVTAGVETVPSFRLTCSATPGGTFDITHISVTAA